MEKGGFRPTVLREVLKFILKVTIYTRPWRTKSLHRYKYSGFYSLTISSSSYQKV